MEEAGTLRIGEVAKATGLTIRTLHYYEEIGLLAAPERSESGHRRYEADDLERLYRICLLRKVGLPLADIARTLDDDEWSLGSALAKHTQQLERRVASEQRLLRRLAQVPTRSESFGNSTTEQLLMILEDMTMLDTNVQFRISTLVCDDIAASASFLERVFGLGPAQISLDGDGSAVHGEIQAGDGVIWLHPESEEFQLASPKSLGGSSAMVSVLVDDVDAHFEHARAESAEVIYEPVDQPYGYREYSARDLDGHLWSFMRALD